MQNLMDLYLADELTAELNLEAEKHLIRCTACSGEARSLEQARRLLRESVAPEEPSPSFRERTSARLLDALSSHLRPAYSNAPSRQWSLPFLTAKPD